MLELAAPWLMVGEAGEILSAKSGDGEEEAIGSVRMSRRRHSQRW
jgi:hypothetical protein